MGWYRPEDPDPSVASILLCRWSAQPSGAHRLTPDGCSDLLWLSNDSKLWMCGTETRSWTFELPPDVTAVGCRFRPGLASQFFGFDASRIRNRQAPMRHLAEPALHEWVLSIERRLTIASTDAERGVILEHAVAERASAFRADALIGAVTQFVIANPHRSARELANILAISERTLHRRAIRSFGYGIATLSRIVRFQRFVAAWSSKPAHATIAALAAQAGYADHSHLARDCRVITGLTPSAFVAEWFPTFPDMSDPYKTDRTFLATLAG
jgi:AraC-like DNA-binding protein